jgi:CxxC motif-containing protein (DUF1111 family)
MKRSYLAWWFGTAVLIFAPVALRVLTWSNEPPLEASPGDVRTGEMLFLHEWQPKDPLCNGGDGLGPVYNAKSCVACHKQGGAGGGGGLEHNVTTFMIQSRDPDQPVREGVIHGYAISPAYQETLALVHSQLPAISRPKLSQILHLGRVPNMGPPELPVAEREDVLDRHERRVPKLQLLELPQGVSLAQRNTPALFGAGLIDAIPERVILANAKRQRLRYGLAPGDTEHLPVGRVARLPDGRVGRFGWKAQSARLGDFVQAACANELGLSNPGHAQPQPLGKPNYQAIGLDLTQKQCDQMTAFIASLPRPVERMPADRDHQAGAERGKALFNKVGCAACHTPDLGSVSGLYSDLLLHRMGQDLQAGDSSYGGGTPPPDRSPGDGTLAEEWRTPPLWGVADSGPYLHDGRAATLEDAIRLHGGQGARAAQNFGQLRGSEQLQLIAFLKTLRAPAARPR